MKAVILSCCLLAFGGDDPFAAGVAAYRAGRFPDALTAFTRAVNDAGDDASAELLHNQALAALGAGELRIAELAIERAAARGGPSFVPLRDFVLGNVAWQRCAIATAQASGPEAEPFAFDLALAHAQAAKVSFARAAVSRSDWPEARRNLERVLAAMDRLREQKAAAMERRKKTATPDAKPLPVDQQDGAFEEQRQPQEVRPDLQVAPLQPEQVRALFDRIARNERQKATMRAATQRAARGAGGKDW